MKKDIIIVDDEKDIRELISGILSDEGFETRLAKGLDSLKTELINIESPKIFCFLPIENIARLKIITPAIIRRPNFRFCFELDFNFRIEIEIENRQSKLN